MPAVSLAARRARSHERWADPRLSPGLGGAVEHHALALEHFQEPGAGPEIVCPACEYHIDPAAPFSAPSFGDS